MFQKQSQMMRLNHYLQIYNNFEDFIMDNKKFLDFEGLKKYHDVLTKKLKDLDFNSQMMFDNKSSLVDLNNWKHDQYGRVYGLKKGLIVTVETSIWQLVNPETFKIKLSSVGLSNEEKSSLTADELGWRIIGSTTDFDVEKHTLNLKK